MAEDPKPYIKNADQKILRPAVCKISGDQIELSNGDLVYITADNRPIKDEYKDKAKYVASVEKGIGHPWNGIHPETGETEALESTIWWNLQDIKEL